MLKLRQLLYRSQYSSQTPFFVLHKSFIHVNGSALLPTISRQSFRYKRNLQQNVRFIFMKAGNIKAVAKSPTDKAAASVKAVVTVKLTVGDFLSNLGKDQGLDALTGLLCKTLLLELVSAEIDPKTGLEKATIKGSVQRTSRDDEEVKFESSFEVPPDFGEIGAFFVVNEHRKEIYLKDVVLNGFPNGPVNVDCNSWVHSKCDNPQKRIFFSNKITYINFPIHGDTKDEPWWPVLKTPKDLIEIITTIVRVSSAHHAAVNFGQYAYAGYFPNRPTIARTNMPTEDPSEESWSNFLRRPEDELLRCFPSQIQATRMMAVMDILSKHSPDEEYLGETIEPTWAEDPFIKAAFERFNGRLVELEGIIDERNANRNLKNRNGAGVLPYELLKPFSPPGVTGKGVPYSISI